MNANIIASVKPEVEPGFTKISNGIRGSNIQWRAKSFAASNPSKPQRHQKKVLKEERRAMVESFVDKYKALNAGKFPTPSTARKQVGGSYYVIKKILQELEYKSKISPISKRCEDLLGKEVAKEEHKSLTKAEKVSSSGTKVSYTSCEPSLGVEKDMQMVFINDMEMEEATGKHFEAKEAPQVSTSVGKTVLEEAVKSTTTGDCSNSAGTHSDQVKVETEEVVDPCPEKLEDGKKDVTTSDGLMDFNGPKGEIKQCQETRESDKFERIPVPSLSKNFLDMKTKYVLQLQALKTV
ncbi:hypothetical protein HHK36_006536 [Tetracentron sinense]|uniref:AT3G52170-like helix-turn-helix domain-containing protein n=1 Tax=Tetracentron sinense TaxID=13715 RepID=A0A834ZHD3_TETSI|nr:hypothetical protein HHK36_006536 [Tetracentron sinense]